MEMEEKFEKLRALDADFKVYRQETESHKTKKRTLQKHISNVHKQMLSKVDSNLHERVSLTETINLSIERKQSPVLDLRSTIAQIDANRSSTLNVVNDSLLDLSSALAVIKASRNGGRTESEVIWTNDLQKKELSTTTALAKAEGALAILKALKYKDLKQVRKVVDPPQPLELLTKEQEIEKLTKDLLEERSARSMDSRRLIALEEERNKNLTRIVELEKRLQDAVKEENKENDKYECYKVLKTLVQVEGSLEQQLNVVANEEQTEKENNAVYEKLDIVERTNAKEYSKVLKTLVQLKESLSKEIERKMLLKNRMSVLLDTVQQRLKQSLDFIKCNTSGRDRIDSVKKIGKERFADSSLKSVECLFTDTVAKK